MSQTVPKDLPCKGGWGYNQNYRIEPTDETIFDRKCEVCGCGYETTLKDNSVLTDALVYKGGSKLLRTSYWKGSLVEYSYDIVKILCSKCPNCGYESQIGCIPTGRVQKKRQWITAGF